MALHPGVEASAEAGRRQRLARQRARQVAGKRVGVALQPPDAGGSQGRGQVHLDDTTPCCLCLGDQLGDLGVHRPQVEARLRQHRLGCLLIRLRVTGRRSSEGRDRGVDHLRDQSATLQPRLVELSREPHRHDGVDRRVGGVVVGRVADPRRRVRARVHLLQQLEQEGDGPRGLTWVPSARRQSSPVVSAATDLVSWSWIASSFASRASRDGVCCLIGDCLLSSRTTGAHPAPKSDSTFGRWCRRGRARRDEADVGRRSCGP